MKPECVGFVEDQADQTDGSSQEVLSNALSSQSDQAAEKPASESTNVGAPLPVVNTIEIDSCEPNFLSDLRCTGLEVEANTCFSYVETHPCFGSTLKYCRPIYSEDIDCTTSPKCKDGDLEIDNCNDLDNCYASSNCGGTIFCLSAN